MSFYKPTYYRTLILFGFNLMIMAALVSGGWLLFYDMNHAGKQASLMSASITQAQHIVLNDP